MSYETLVSSIQASLEALARSERITRTELNNLAINTLKVYEDPAYTSVDVMNMPFMQDVLTPLNKELLIEFYKQFLPHNYGEKIGKFGKRIKGAKAIAKYTERRKAFLDSGKSIWDFKEDMGIKAQTKDVDWGKRVTSAVKSALDDEKGGMDLLQILAAVEEGGVSLTDIAIVLEELRDAA